jgi:hypothetical protein
MPYNDLAGRHLRDHMGTVTTINNLEAAKALAATIQKPAQPVELKPQYQRWLSELEAGTSPALLWKDARGRVQIIFEGESHCPERYASAMKNTFQGRALNPYILSLDDLGYGGQLWLINQDGEERYHCNLWSADQIDADAQSAFEPFLNCSYVREANHIEKKVWLSGEGF